MRIAIEQLQLEELQSFLREQAEDAFSDLKDAERLKILSEKWHSHAEFCTCRDENKKLIGMIAFYANLPETGTAYIPHVYVSSYYRRQKLFTCMYSLVEKVIIEKGFKIIKLEVGIGNAAAQRAYSKEGFEKDSVCSLQTVLMQKKI